MLLAACCAGRIAQQLLFDARSEPWVGSGWLPFAGWICCPSNSAQKKIEGIGGETNLRFPTSWWPELTGPDLLFHSNLSAFKVASVDREKTREKHPCR